jgi:hypothetical protein
VLEPPASRRDRQRLAANLAYLGYGTLDEATWVATRSGEDVDADARATLSPTPRSGVTDVAVGMGLRRENDRAFLIRWERVRRPGSRCSTRPSTSRAGWA